MIHSFQTFWNKKIMDSTNNHPIFQIKKIDKVSVKITRKTIKVTILCLAM